MRKILPALTILILAPLACSLPGRATPDTGTQIPEPVIVPTGEPVVDTPAPATEIPTATPTIEVLPVDGMPVFFDPLGFILPAGLASGISGELVPRTEAEDGGPWSVAPDHSVITLDGYLLPDTFHSPRIYIFPATEYGEMYPPAFEAIHRLNNINGGSGGPVEDQLPGVPFFNAGPVFSARVEQVEFQGGAGVRFLTEYAQYFAPVNNHDLFYMFQGLTADGAYYIIAILPVASPLLPDSSDPEAEIPADGVAYPGFDEADADWEAYYTLVTERLNTASPDSFTPALDVLDAMIETMTTGP